jgi:diguanylate cyclase (GGDEF)-like protein
MGRSPEPPDELARQAALYALGVLDTAPEEEFDRIARLAQRLLGVSSAIVSFMDYDRQWYKARVGVDATEAARPETFCTHVIADGQPLLVEDARLDPRFADNPHVVTEPGVRFYAGVPIHSPGNYAVGTLCVFDDTPRAVGDRDMEPLFDLAAMVDEIIDARVRTTVDGLTGLQNRAGFVQAGEPLLRLADRTGTVMTLGFFDVNGLKQVNDTLGHDAGDRAIAATAELLGDSFRSADVVARLGGDEFAVLFGVTDSRGAAAAVARLEAALAARNARGDLPFQLGVASGFVERPPGGESLDRLLARADAAMYERKQRRSNA